ncbi:transposase [bacterium]|nr:transposase [bacterium]
MNYDLIQDCFPEYLIKQNVFVETDRLTINFSSKRTSQACPKCNQISKEITTYFTRKVQDLPVIDKSLTLKIKLKKFRCNNKKCNTKIFSENIDDFVQGKQRRTNRLNKKLIAFALTYSAEGAAKLLKNHHNITVSGDTLLRLAKSITFDYDPSEIKEIGIDDFALKKNIGMELYL